MAHGGIARRMHGGALSALYRRVMQTRKTIRRLVLPGAHRWRRRQTSLSKPNQHLQRLGMDGDGYIEAVLTIIMQNQI